MGASSSPVLPKHLALLAVLGAPIFFWGLGDYGPVNGDEAVYQTIAREMSRTGDWWTLRIQGQRQWYDTFMNAPLHYWARAALISLFGDTLWTMRFLAAAFGMLTMLAVYAVALRVTSARGAIAAALVQGTTYQFVYLHSGRTGELEPILSCLFLIVAALFLRSIQTGRSFLPHHIGLFLIPNLKLPLLAIPVLAELAYFALVPKSRKHFRRWAILGLLLAPIGLSWHLWHVVFHGTEAWTVLGIMFSQASGSHDVVAARDVGIVGNLLLYGETVLYGAFPWGLLYLPALGLALTLARRSHESSRRDQVLFAIFPAALLAFYAFVDKHYRWYVIPAYPFLSIFVGLWIDRLLTVQSRSTAVAQTLLLALVPWIAIDLFGSSPFDREGFETAFGSVRWGAPSSPALVLAAGAAGIAMVVAAIGPVSVAQRIALTSLALFAVLASARVIAPLGGTEHETELQRLELRLAREPGVIEEPVVVRSRFMRKVWYHFADEFRVHCCRGPEERFFVLVDRRAKGIRVDCKKLEIPATECPAWQSIE